jgi:hypothetical protein
MNATALRASLLAALMLGAGAARAQSLAPVAAPSASPTRAPGGDDLATSRAAWGYSAPLRWSLMGAAPRFGPALPGCEEGAESRGNTTGGAPNEYFVSWRLTPPRLGPSLYLVGFARHGCPVDAGAGGGLVFTMPLSPNIFLTASTGLYGLPRNGIAKPEKLGDARLDLGFRTSPQQTVTVGVGLRGVFVGGLW